MSLVPSLLQAIVKVDGEAMVMHAGDKPYVVSPTGQVELASRGLTLEAVNGIVGQLLPSEIQNALEEFGAIQYELPAAPEFPGEHFTVVAARGGDDVWVEIRRRRVPDDDHVPEELFAPAPARSATSSPPPAASQVERPAPIAAAPPPPRPAPPVMPAAAPPPAPLSMPQPSLQDDIDLEAAIEAIDEPIVNLAPPPAPDEEIEVSLDGPIELDEDLALPDATQLWPARPPRTGEDAAPTPRASVGSAGATDDDFSAIEVDEPMTTIRSIAPPPPQAPTIAAPIAPRAVSPVGPPAPTIAAPTAPPAVSPVERSAPKIAAPTAPPAVSPVERPAPKIAAPTAPPAASPVERPAPKIAAPVAPPAASPVERPAPKIAAPTAPPAVSPVERPTPKIAASMAPPAPVEDEAALSIVADTPVTGAIEPLAPEAAGIPPPVAATHRAVPPPERAEPPAARSIEPPQPAVVLPISRSPIRAETPPPLVSDPTLSGLERLLRLSSARGASTLYLSSESRPSVRVDGELQNLDGEPVHTSRDVESLLLTLMPERSHEALRTGALTEWICDIEGVGRVRCMSFRDHRGPGGVFRLMPTRSVSAEQLGLPKHVQALAIEPEGLVLVAGPRSSGKRTLMAAFVDLMNHTRRDHIITIEREINIVHERGSSFISQREVRGSDEEMLAAARGALREDPDVLVIEDLRTGPLMNVALEAAASGHLVVGGFSAHTAAGAIDRIIDLYAPEYRRQVQFALAGSLRGVIVQVLLRKVGGGRLPAREVLLNTPAVSSVIAEGKTSQLPMAIEGGRRYGMMPMNDALVGLVQSGAVDARDAYRRSSDRPGLLAALNRQGIDTSFVERLA